jgi:hypothetical protein
MEEYGYCMYKQKLRKKLDFLKDPALLGHK